MDIEKTRNYERSIHIYCFFTIPSSTTFNAFDNFINNLYIDVFIDRTSLQIDNVAIV